METTNPATQALFLNILLLLLGGLQGLLLCYLLLRKKAYQHGYGYLLLYLLVLIGQLLFKVMDKIWMMQHVNSGYQTSYLFPFLYGPLVWLFARNIQEPQFRFKPKHVLHFLPFVVAFFTVIFRVQWQWVAWMRDWSGLLLQLVLLGVYHSRALQLLRFTQQDGEETTLERAEKLSWVRRFALHSWWICSVLACLLVLMYQTNPVLAHWRYGFVLLTVFIYWVSYRALQQPSLFFAGEALTNGHPVLPNRGKKYANSSLKEATASQILEALQLAMSEKKAFTEPELTIEKLAALVQTNRHALSQVLNERLGLSFFDYINGKRVEEVKRMLIDPAYSHLKIAAIAHDSGFKSMSVFNDVFKKHTGQTPSSYRKSAQKTAISEEE